MRTLAFISTLFALLLLAPAAALAQDGGQGEFVVTPGEEEQIPIAVPRILGSDAALSQALTDTLVKDLEISGLFNVLPPQTFNDLASEGLSTTAYDQWSTTRAQVVVKGRFTLSGDRLTLDLRAYSVLKRSPIQLTYQAPLATTTSHRQAVHAFANALIEYFGGGGIFGQHLFVVRRNRAKGQSHVYRLGTDGEGMSKVSSGSDINLSPSLGPSGEALFVSYRSNGPALVRGTRVLIDEDVLSRADYCPGNGQVVVALSRDGNPEIYTMSASGSGLTRLTDNAYIDTSPTWSPDCSQIAFVSNRAGSPQIYVMGSGGGSAKRLTGADLGSYNTSPSWSPSGEWIAFSGRQGGTFDIFLLSPQTQEIVRITQDQGSNEDPTWSPDGKYLAFVSRRSSGSGLYIASLRGQGSFQALIAPGSGFAMPAWSY